MKPKKKRERLDKKRAAWDKEVGDSRNARVNPQSFRKPGSVNKP